MAFTASGNLYKVMETKQITDSFKKREFVLEIVDGAYTQLVPFQLTQNNCEKLDSLAVGSGVSVTFNLRGREWKDKEGVLKYFGSLDAWKIETTVGNAQATTPQQQGVAEVQTGGDLPF
jgi:single-strand DNA-binding protein